MKFDIWMQGFSVTENNGTAKFLGTYEADSFLDACQMAANKHPEYGDYDPESNDIWGCRLFDNETDARKSFG